MDAFELSVRLRCRALEQYRAFSNKILETATNLELSWGSDAFSALSVDEKLQKIESVILNRKTVSELENGLALFDRLADLSLSELPSYLKQKHTELAQLLQIALDDLIEATQQLANVAAASPLRDTALQAVARHTGQVLAQRQLLDEYRVHFRDFL